MCCQVSMAMFKLWLRLNMWCFVDTEACVNQVDMVPQVFIDNLVQMLEVMCILFHMLVIWDNLWCMSPIPLWQCL